MADKKVFKIGNKVALYLEPPDLPRPDRDIGFSKTTIWVERGEFYGSALGPAVQTHNPEKPDKRIRSPKQASTPEPYLIIGFDTEFVAPPRLTIQQIREGVERKTAGVGKNQILSYQVSAIGPNGEQWNAIACTEEIDGNAERITFGEFIVFALGSGLRSGAIQAIPRKIYLAGHFTRADFTAFSDFQEMTDVLSNIRNTFATTEKPLNVEITFPEGDSVEVQVYTRDTMLLTPQSSKNLRAVGDLVALPKIALHDDPDEEQRLKETMDEVRRNRWELFQSYALRDAEICAVYLQKIARKHNELTGRTKVPATLTGIGVQLLLNTWNQRGENAYLNILGKEIVTERVFKKRLGYYIKEQRTVLLEEVHWFQAFAIECYHGGRGEQFWFGPSYEAEWVDYDLSSAYPTAMSLIGYPRWREVYTSYSVDDYQPTTLGVACVDFEFPPEIRYPTLPVRTENGIIFPKTGRSYCAAPEIALAQKLGCKINVRFGIIVPTNADDPVFLSFIKTALDERAKSQKGTLESNFWKEIANSLYGKTAQGLYKKRVFDMRDRDMRELPESEITNPYFAAFITSFVRATMGEIMNALPRSTMVFSCTTDGFLTDASTEQVEKATKGSLSQIYGQQRGKLTNDNSVLEIKHRARQLLGWRARGQATIKPAIPLHPGDKTTAMPLAKGGIHLIDHYENDELENKAILDLFFHRTDETAFPVHSLAGVRQVVMFDIDSVPVLRFRSLNMEYDWKRRPFDVKESTEFNHIAFSTVPWDHYTQFRTVRDVNEADKTPPIKKSKDLSAFIASIETTLALSSAKRSKARKSHRALNILMKTMSVIWHYDRQILGNISEDHTARDFANNLTAAGCPCTRSDIENGTKRKDKKFVPHGVPATKETIEVLEKLREAYPAIDPSQFLATPTRTSWLTFYEGGLVCPFMAKLN